MEIRLRAAPLFDSTLPFTDPPSKSSLLPVLPLTLPSTSACCAKSDAAVAYLHAAAHARAGQVARRARGHDDVASNGLRADRTRALPRRGLCGGCSCKQPRDD